MVRWYICKIFVHACLGSSCNAHHYSVFKCMNQTSPYTPRLGYISLNFNFLKVLRLIIAIEHSYAWSSYCRQREMALESDLIHNLG